MLLFRHFSLIDQALLNSHCLAGPFSISFHTPYPPLITSQLSWIFLTLPTLTSVWILALWFHSTVHTHPSAANFSASLLEWTLLNFHWPSRIPNLHSSISSRQFYISFSAHYPHILALLYWDGRSSHPYSHFFAWIDAALLHSTLYSVLLDGSQSQLVPLRLDCHNAAYNALVFIVFVVLVSSW